MIELTPYQSLANAIVEQAANDYRNALCGHSVRRKDPKFVIDECEHFFRSTYFSHLTNVDGEYLIEEIRKGADE